MLLPCYFVYSGTTFYFVVGTYVYLSSQTCLAGLYSLDQHQLINSDLLLACLQKLRLENLLFLAYTCYLINNFYDQFVYLFNFSWFYSQNWHILQTRLPNAYLFYDLFSLFFIINGMTFIYLNIYIRFQFFLLLLLARIVMYLQRMLCRIVFLLCMLQYTKSLFIKLAQCQFSSSPFQLILSNILRIYIWSNNMKSMNLSESSQDSKYYQMAYIWLRHISEKTYKIDLLLFYAFFQSYDSVNDYCQIDGLTEAEYGVTFSEQLIIQLSSLPIQQDLSDLRLEILRIINDIKSQSWKFAHISYSYYFQSSGRIFDFILFFIYRYVEYNVSYTMRLSVSFSSITRNIKFLITMFFRNMYRPIVDQTIKVIQNSRKFFKNLLFLTKSPITSWLSLMYSYISGVFLAKLIKTLLVYPNRLSYRLG